MANPPVSDFIASCASIEEWLRGANCPWGPLTARELQSYTPRSILTGWRLEVAFTDRMRRIDVLIEAGFPWRAPLISLVDRPPHLTWPHIESDGVMCLLPGEAEVDAGAPAAVLRNLLGKAIELIEPEERVSDQEAFRREFNSYWPVDNKALPILSLLRPDAGTRRIVVWRGQQITLVGDDSALMRRWLMHRNGDPSLKTKFVDGLLIWRDTALVPSEYPNTGAEVRSLAAACRADDLLDGLVRGLPESFVVVIGATTLNGPVLAGVEIKKPAKKNLGPHRNAVESFGSGFRKNHLPVERVRTAYLGSGRVVRARVERVDAAWVHGRDRDRRLPRLRTARIVVIGCGSLGGAVAMQLARAGVSRLSLIDPDRLSWANIGRHELGAMSVGFSKAEQLACLIRRQLPHIESVEDHFARWEEVERDNPNVLAGADLIVSTTGAGGAELALNAWHMAQARSVPIAYGWTEPHACAGQVVVVGSSGACFGCCVNKFGASKLQVTEWPAETALQEPACGAVFQPYGPIELQHIAAMIAEAVVGRLLSPERSEPEYRVWMSSSEMLATAGGRWTKEWEQRMPAKRHGGSLVTVPLTAAPDCRACAKGG